MTRDLESVFVELGLSQYFDSFVEQGFDSWDTILDIQESDLDALGVKLGHRRKLQRRIANARGIAPSISLASPLKVAPDEAKSDTVRHEPTRSEANHESQGVAKRKYRRHPKSDDNAPDRPPSAYVLFSNKMREDLKSQNLTFTEIAKLVGENWQSLAPGEKEAYESQANAAKEKYHRDLMEYKKTPEYRKYAQYLHDFKEKQARQKQAHDAAKRPRIEAARLRHGSSSSSATPGGTSSGSGTGSGSERLQGSEPPPSRRERMNSTASMNEAHHSATVPTGLAGRRSMEESISSPRRGHFDRSSPVPSNRGHSRKTSSWRETGRAGDSNQHLPSLSDMLDDGKIPAPMSAVSDGHPYSNGFVAANRRPGEGSLTLQNGRTPLLRHEPSSNGSSGSSSSVGSFGRSVGDGPLPIHALLSNRSLASPAGTPYEQSPASSLASGMSPTEPSKALLSHDHGPRGYGFQSSSSAFQHMKTEQAADGDVVMTQADAFPHSGRTSFDGMNALLTAGEIVSRHSRG